MAQFFVDTNKGELSCQMYQRSADLGLGVPFNIASYALLTCMVASVCGLKPAEFIHTLGDAHVYCNHVEPLKEQLLRTPKAFPKLFVREGVTDIDAFTPEDFKIEGYAPHPKIAMEMAV
jgi:thymidylate synthase